MERIKKRERERERSKKAVSYKARQQYNQHFGRDIEFAFDDMNKLPQQRYTKINTIWEMCESLLSFFSL